MHTSPCDTCPDPGHCCRNFPLNIEFSKEATADDVQAEVRKRGLPFVPRGPAEWTEANGKQRWRFDCPRLMEDGRCGDYENRPNLCRIYEPGTDALCVLHEIWEAD